MLNIAKPHLRGNVSLQETGTDDEQQKRQEE
jgi:hypothetical protein